MSRRKSGCYIHGILLLDKHLGISSNHALQQVKRLFNANKLGHTGSLDPIATGLLPLCFGEATKVSAMLLDAHKRYQVLVKLGTTTETGDTEGKVIAEKVVPKLTQQDIKVCLQSFTGKIEQIPPMYSALKYKGRKLYELAREGKTIERKARRINIFELKLLQATANSLTLEVFCSKGTYIRSLAEDIGDKLGCGGTVAALRRTQVGQFKLEEALTFEHLRQMDKNELMNCLLEVDKSLENIPAIKLSAQQAILIKHGQAIKTGEAKTIQGIVRMYSEQIFLGLGEMSLDGRLLPKKIFNIDCQAPV